MEKASGNQHTKLCSESGQGKTAQLAEHGITRQRAAEYEQLAGIPEDRIAGVPRQPNHENPRP